MDPLTAEMYRAHVVGGMTLREIAREFGMSHTMVSVRFREAGLPVRSRKQAKAVRQARMRCRAERVRGELLTADEPRLVAERHGLTIDAMKEVLS